MVILIPHHNCCCCRICSCQTWEMRPHAAETGLNSHAARGQCSCRISNCSDNVSHFYLYAVPPGRRTLRLGVCLSEKEPEMQCLPNGVRRRQIPNTMFSFSLRRSFFLSCIAFFFLYLSFLCNALALSRVLTDFLLAPSWLLVPCTRTTPS
jgi:hypothetical protein